MHEVLNHPKLKDESRRAINRLSAAVEKRLSEMSAEEKTEAIRKIVRDFAFNALFGDEGFDDAAYARCRVERQLLVDILELPQ